MNLIEQLGEKESLAAFVVNGFGGYEKAKAVLDNPNYSLLHNTKALKERLLEYRRENNIFEVGDKVVYKGKAGLSGLFEIETLTKTGKPKTVKTKRFGNFPCRYCEVQHATPKEIAQGYRDE